jgi:anthranilate phosphoribosyltransferase
MAKVFEKMASLSGFDRDDFEDFFARVADLSAAEIGGVLGYLLGRLDSEDAAAMVSALRNLHPQREIRLTDGRRTLNIVGTGGGPSTFNITTTTCFVIATAGVAVIKTGSAACRSACGFADVAVRLGTLKVTMPWEQIESIVDKVGIVFVPPSYHARILGELEYRLSQRGYRSAGLYLNKIGPLLSPVKVDHRFIGAHSADCMEMLCGACRILGDIPTTLFCGLDGLDEVSSMARTRVLELAADGTCRQSWIDPHELAIRTPSLDELRGLEPAAATECCELILSGKADDARTEIVALNAGAVLASFGFASDLTTGFQEAMRILRSGDALGKLRALRERVWKCANR